jgi:GNAT superfamily N-acetyltransferase
MKVIEVKDLKSAQEFLLLPVKLYANEKNWIRPLDKDIESVFDPARNKYFRHGEAIRWIIQNDQGETIGRIAAFIDRKAKKHQYKSGGVGFYESIDDSKVAHLLFDTSKAWLAERGMEAMDGPINFGERHEWWGLLVKGFIEPNYKMGYHLPYYKELFESYGWQLYYEQYTYHRKVEDPLPELYQAKADRIARDPRYHFEHITRGQFERYVEDFRGIYNKAWINHTGVKEMPKAAAMAQMSQLKPILDEELIWFAYYDKEPIAFFIMIPEVNQIFKHLNGKFNLLAKLKFLYYQKIAKSCKKMFGVVFGVVPDHQGKGIEGAIVMAAAKIIQPSGRYTDFEMNWIGSFNPKMIKISESVGAKVVKTHYTYRYVFDRSLSIEPCPVIE